ncbi:MAG TPA: hypothetical protein VM408_08775, partial [Methylomirabilota bacterium]|nr:hypothetical protein [Methylomirabilota bacterium]
MDESGRSAADREAAPAAATPSTEALERPVFVLPPPPFVDPVSFPAAPRFARLSPRVAVLIATAIVVGILLWMARDAVRPFIVGLLLVYLL